MKENISVGSIGAPIFSYKPHSHPEWELIYYTGGEGKVIIEDLEYSFESGTIFVIPPNVVHSDTSPGGYTNLYVNFSDNTIPPIPFGALDNPSRDIYNLLLILQREYMLHIKNHEQIMNLLLETVFAYINVFAISDKTNDYVENMKQIIISNYTEVSFSLNQMYDSININSDYARRLFVKETGYTPSNYLKRLKIKKAKELLGIKNVKFTIYDIAQQSGFSDQYHFSKIFKQVTGLSPMAWKKQHRS